MPMDHIKKAYCNDKGGFKIPSDKELETIEYDRAGMHTKGNLLTVGGGAIGLLGSYIVYQIPYVGPVIAVISLIGTAAISKFGLEVTKASENLEVYEQRTSNVVENFKTKLIKGDKNSEEAFMKEVYKTATKGTFFGGWFYNLVLRDRTSEDRIKND